MPRFAANLSLMYNEMAFLERFRAAHEDGFKFVECLFPYAHPMEVLSQLIKDNHLQQVLINTPPAGGQAEQVAKMWDLGLRGVACLPGKEQEFEEGFMLALRYAKALACSKIHVMAGCVPEPYRVPQEQLDRFSTSGALAQTPGPLLDTYLSNLYRAAKWAELEGIEVLIEPINTRDIPHYFLNQQAQAHHIVKTLGLPNIKVQMDLYHCQIVEGDLIEKIKHYLPTGQVGHIQVAGVPLRQELQWGELNYIEVFAHLDEVAQACGWSGCVGLEYRPREGLQVGGTSRGLAWLKSSVDWLE